MDFYKTFLEFDNIRAQETTFIQDANLGYALEDCNLTSLWEDISGSYVMTPGVVHELKNLKNATPYKLLNREVEFVAEYQQQIVLNGTSTGILSLGENMSIEYVVMILNGTSTDAVWQQSMVEPNSIVCYRLFNNNGSSVTLSRKSSMSSGDFELLTLGYVTKWPGITDDAALFKEAESLGQKVFTSAHIIAAGFKDNLLSKDDATNAFGKIENRYLNKFSNLNSYTFNKCLERM